MKASATIWLPRLLIQRLVDAADAHGDNETGGMLVGYEGAERSDEIVVTDVIGPGPRARHGEYAFNPDGAWQRRQLARLYRASGRVTTFLGDWHSHPRGLPLPSETDVATAARTAANERARAPRPLTLIVGRDADEWLLACYRFIDGELALARVRDFDQTRDLLDDLDPPQMLAQPRSALTERKRGRLTMRRQR